MKLPRRSRPAAAWPGAGGGGALPPDMASRPGGRGGAERRPRGVNKGRRAGPSRSAPLREARRRRRRVKRGRRRVSGAGG